MHRYKKINNKLNEQAIHFEIMINKVRPDLLNDRMKTAKSGPITRTDVRRIQGEDAENMVVTDILLEKGVISENQRTIFDFFKERFSKTEGGQESINLRQDKDENMFSILESLKKIE